MNSDLNIVDDFWKLLVDDIYGCPQFKKIIYSKEKINSTIKEFNSWKREMLQELYTIIRQRWCKVLKTNRNICNL